MDDPLPALIKTIRKAHHMSQIQVAVCMAIAEDSYRHIESKRRRMPDVFHGMSDWIARFLKCVGATEEERKALVGLAARLAVEELSRALDE